ncbi:MAG TPA: hypothetical protein DDX71_07110 [Ruminococcus sp.]|nr:hypothetical protein [Ruminococcus sp.]
MKHRIMTAVLTAALLLTGCAENPESSVIVHKDMEKVIEEAAQTGESKADVAQLRQYDSYTADFESESLRVSVHADAQVDIPQADQLSVFRVKQHDFTQEDVDRFRNALMGDVPLYEGAGLQVRTKKEYEEDIRMIREEIKRSYDEFDAETAAENEKAYQRELDYIQEQYEAAPEEINVTEHPSAGKLETVAAQLAADPESEYWQWQNSLNPEGSVSFVCNADVTAAFYVQNDADHSNNIVYSASPVGPERMTVMGGGVYLDQDPVDIPGAPENFLANGICPGPDESAAMKLLPIPGDSAELSQADAEKQAEDFLHSMGLDDFQLYEGGKYAKRLDLSLQDHDPENANTFYYRTSWILNYCRSFDGVMLEQNSGVKYAEGWEGESYRKQFWPGEYICFEISDAGIVGFSWNAPLDIMETVVENAALKPFDEISGTFERMMPMVAAPKEQYEEDAMITVDRVTLSYSRISEKDSFDTGLVIPVWGFLGDQKGGSMSFTGTQMAINAIDGSVIDASLGY